MENNLTQQNSPGRIHKILDVFGSIFSEIGIDIIVKYSMPKFATSNIPKILIFRIIGHKRCPIFQGITWPLSLPLST